mgnify:CR=1 FL=1
MHYDYLKSRKRAEGRSVMEKELILFVVTHKHFYDIPSDRNLIGVGKNGENIKCDYRDDVGDNISYKNPNYCELTALYWIWKNIDCDYVGFEQYRRFFCGKKLLHAESIKRKKILKILKSGKIILPKRHWCDSNVYNEYRSFHNIKDLNVCIDIIKHDYPEYISSLNNVLNAKKIYPANMFMMPKSMMNEYCQWLFAILDKAESNIDISRYKLYQARVFGFLAERLFNVWIDYAKPKILRLSVYSLNDIPLLVLFKKLIRKIEQYTHKVIRKLKYKLNLYR